MINFELFKGKTLYIASPRSVDYSLRPHQIIAQGIERIREKRNMCVVSGPNLLPEGFADDLAQALEAPAVVSRCMDRAGLNPHLIRSTGELAAFAVKDASNLLKLTEREVLGQGLVVCLQLPFVDTFRSQRLIEGISPGLFRASITFDVHPQFDGPLVRQHGDCAL